MKLSKAQEKVLEEAKRKIDHARSLDYPEWLKEYNSWFKPCENSSKEYNEKREKEWKKAVNEERAKAFYEERKEGIVSTHCNTRTLKKLEDMNLIEIIHDSTGEQFGIDYIKVLNY